MTNPVTTEYDPDLKVAVTKISKNTQQIVLHFSCSKNTITYVLQNLRAMVVHRYDGTCMAAHLARAL